MKACKTDVKPYMMMMKMKMMMMKMKMMMMQRINVVSRFGCKKNSLSFALHI